MLTKEKPDINKFLNEFIIRVRYEETDQMGVVYYSKYFVWFEIGRTELIRNAGPTYKDLEHRSIFLPISECACKYIKPARYDDEIIIRTKIKDLTKVSITFDYEIYNNQNKELLATGYTKHVFIDKNYKIIRVGYDIFP